MLLKIQKSSQFTWLGESDGASYREPDKILEPEILHPQKIPGIKFFNPKKYKT